MFKYIEVDPARMGGVPTLAGTRMPVSQIIEMLAEGMSIKDILEDYDHYSEELIKGALLEVADIFYNKKDINWQV